MTESLVRLEKQGAITIITLDNPPVNAASTKLMNALHARLDEVERDREARCVILTGAGDRAFCAGGDLREEKDFGSPEASKAFRALGRKTLNRLEAFPIPIVAAIHGFCIGGGTAIGWACDIRIAADNSVFRAGDAYIGMVPSWGMGLTRLPRYVGRNRALDILLLGQDFDAQTAYEFGLVTKVVKKEDLAKEAMKAAERIASASPFAIKATRDAIAFNSRESWKDMVDFEIDICEKVFAHPDAHEGPKAFSEKRKPKFGAL
ncbi:MAG: enoyl-CoA hydratase/isomerase family protein [Candidatus Afipia apatlaquensis]|uniref:Enoyl-CoA hydratase/isomerase family protein n=1 Tax=Candidatus Afipia apatlaquensis TaxID=2712852 RepID=A0A7C9RLE1_9BRAD|nr:enoyl-CoA hydratase/isomerase family protein [Candidatus Afipia apatlaquensis]